LWKDEDDNNNNNNNNKRAGEIAVLLLRLSRDFPSVSFVSVIIVRDTHLVKLFQILFDYIIFGLNGNFATGINSNISYTFAGKVRSFRRS